MENWIDVKHKMPNGGFDVLVFTDRNLIAFDYIVDGYFYRHFNVTHWMPLPKPPVK